MSKVELSNLRHVTGGEQFPAGHPVENQIKDRLDCSMRRRRKRTALRKAPDQYITFRAPAVSTPSGMRQCDGLAPYLVMTRAGGCQVPSPAGRIDGGVSFGQ
jgi:hypothetical protein